MFKMFGQENEPEEWGLAREAIRQIVAKHAPPEQIRDWDRKHEYPSEFYSVLADAGYLAMPFGEEYGGSGAGPEEMVVVAEELGRCGMDVAAGFGITVFVGLTVSKHGSDELRNQLLPDVLAGRRRLSVSITEPNAGSDAMNVATSATKTADGYVLNGQKVFTTGAGLPNTTMAVAARASTDVGRSAVSVFLVDADTPGVSVRRLETAGRHMLGTYEVFLDDVAIPETARLGPEGEGWRILHAGLNTERLFGCGAYLGSMATVLELATQYSRERRQFDQPIGHFQAISHPLADSFAALGAGRLLTYHAARTLASGADARQEIAAAKLFVGEMYQAAANHAMQVFGGYGYMTEYDVERFWRDARLATITGGTSQIQREILCKSMGMR